MEKTITSNFTVPDYHQINVHYPLAKKLLYGALAIDLFFVLLHLYTFTLPAIEGSVKRLRLDMDLGYAEIFQYLKFITAAILLVVLFTKERKSIYLTWGLFFLILFADDAFAFHEVYGAKFVRFFDIPAMFGLRAQDIGELAMAGLIGLFLAITILYTLVWGQKKAKKITIHFILLIGILVFFGVGMDMLHSFLNHLPGAGILTMIEDGGEMVAGSLILWYAFYLNLDKSNSY